MEQKILETAKEIFGDERFQELSGALWLDAARIWARVRPELVRILKEWENRHRRDVEGGFFRHKGGGRQRAVRLSELKTGLDRLQVRRKF